MRFYRRLPVQIRPLPFFASLGLLCLALTQSFSWQWQGSGMGNPFLLVLFPLRLSGLALEHIAWMTVGLLALAGMVASAFRRTSTSSTGGFLPDLFAPRLRFYPLTMLLGLFLVGSGLGLLLDVFLSLEHVRSDVAAFLYLDHAGIFDRPVLSIVGLLVAGCGVLATYGAFERDAVLTPKARLGTPRVTRLKTIAGTNARVPKASDRPSAKTSVRARG